MTWGKRFVSALGAPYSHTEGVADVLFFVGTAMTLWPGTVMNWAGFPDGNPAYAATMGFVLSAGAVFVWVRLWSRR